ncbi:uncharacterized protein JCM6883_006459 [Sporobolomyces salmoneus]|uniref:uncharacterized protein n=1 Tax=Sporobolomyces salmoneus TaxID=183962 RepID=UPI003177A895
MSTEDKKPATTTAQAAVDDTPLPIPNLKLPQLVFILNEPKASSKREGVLEQVLHLIEQDEMAPYLSHLLSTNSIPSTEQTKTLLSTLEEKNETKLKEMEEKLKDSKDNLGETEVSDTLREIASYRAKIGEKEKALEAHEEAFNKTAGKGTKIDLVLTMIRIGFFHSDQSLVSTNIDRAQKLVDEGGDWDRRNRLKVYRGLQLLSIRSFEKSSELLLDALPTFTATELIDYDEFVTLCVLMGVFSLDRKSLKQKIIESPEVISVLPNVPTLQNYTDSLYKTDYSTFFRSLATIEETHLLPSLLLSPHSRYYTRELRLKAYSQLLESYRSVTLDSLATAFGVTKEWLDTDLARFIATGRLNCSIDKVSGIVETRRPSIKNQRYTQVIKTGDQVLTSVQRLSRVIG